MSERRKNKRHREDSSEGIHTHHKRLKDDHGDAHRVDPRRFTSSFGGHYRRSAMIDDSEEDEDDDIFDKIQSAENKKVNDNNGDDDDDDIGVLLYELASLDVNKKEDEHNANPMQTCPICAQRISLKEFADHVHRCLDCMDDSDRNDMRSQQERDSDFAANYALKHGYQMEYDFGGCPICGKPLVFGTSINEHVNQCLDDKVRRDEQKKDDEEDDDDDDDDMSFDHAKRGKKKVEPLSRQQMIECASKLMTLQQGTQQFDRMLHMFGALGFNKANVRSVLDIEKKNQHQNGGDRASESNHNQNKNQMNLSPIQENDEDVDLQQNQNTTKSQQNQHDFIFDDDDL